MIGQGKRADGKLLSSRTAYFVLGLIASTVEGAEILEELGWETVTSPLYGAMGICVPFDLSLFTNVS